MKHPTRHLRLTIRTPDGKLSTVPLSDGEYIVGRTTSCNIHFKHNSLSRRHARLVVKGTAVTVEDLDSLNGTRVAGTRIDSPTPLPPDQPVFFGDLEATLSLADRPPPPAPVVWLLAVNTSLKGRSWPVRHGRAMVGRDRGTDIRIDHPTISRQHALLRHRPEEGGWLLEDRESVNGTYVNGVMVSQALLTGTETVKLGDVELRLVASKPEPRHRKGLAIVLLVLLGAAIGWLVIDLFGLVLE